jgi:WD40 repeat protein
MIQELSISNRQKKKIQSLITDESILVLEDDDVVIHIANYQSYKEESELTPLEDVLGEVSFDDKAEYLLLL